MVEDPYSRQTQRRVQTEAEYRGTLRQNRQLQDQVRVLKEQAAEAEKRRKQQEKDAQEREVEIKQSIEAQKGIRIKKEKAR